MYLIVGLGNPGPEYAETRHNLGFKVIDLLAGELKLSFKNKCQAEIAETLLGGHKIILAKPQTFMNNSGLAVRELASWYKIAPQKVIVIYDDVDLEVGQLRLREKGNAGGHHGMESVIAHLGTTDFPRIRIGIGRDNLSGDVADYVLRIIPAAQKPALDETVVLAADAIGAIVAEGIAKAMNKFNDRQNS